MQKQSASFSSTFNNLYIQKIFQNFDQFIQNPLFLKTSVYLLLFILFFPIVLFSTISRFSTTILTAIILYKKDNVDIDLENLKSFQTFFISFLVKIGDVSFSIYLIHWPVIIGLKYFDILDSRGLNLYV